jgi:hypothetical protein
VIETSNYYPKPDGEIAALEAGQAESEWVAGQIGRRIAKAWNAITSASFAEKGAAAGAAGRIAIQLLQMVTGSGESQWHWSRKPVSTRSIQAPSASPGASNRVRPATAPTSAAKRCLPLAEAERERLPRCRELAIEAIMERVGDSTTNPDSDHAVLLTRALFM